MSIDGWDYSEYQAWFQSGLDERGEGEQYEVRELAMDTVKLLEADANLDLDAIAIEPGDFRLAGQRVG